MTSNTVSNAVAQQDRSAAALITRYQTEFTSMLPSHINADSWLRAAKAALKKGKQTNGVFDLEQAAQNNPNAFFTALREAASLGLRPGSDEYYLTARKQKGRPEILGIVGYQGEIELIYRAGAVSSVIAEVVRRNDEYRYVRGEMECPRHEFTPFARDAERGELIGVYAYAKMKDGSYSRVVELNQDDIDKARRTSESWQADQKNGTAYSPWTNWPEAMWLKTAIHQLQKWVPTSAEYREALIRDAVAVQSARGGVTVEQDDAPPNVDTDTGEIHDAEVVDEPADGEPQQEQIG